MKTAPIEGQFLLVGNYFFFFGLELPKEPLQIFPFLDFLSPLPIVNDFKCAKIQNQKANLLKLVLTMIGKLLHDRI